MCKPGFRGNLFTFSSRQAYNSEISPKFAPIIFVYRIRLHAMNVYAPFSRPLYVMAKPAGSLCNLRCDYCYYLEKRLLSPSSPLLMDDDTLEEFIRQYLEAQTQPQVLFTWHGGEPLLRPLAFYRRALTLQRRYARGRIIDNCLQTNGTLLNDEWCEFFRQNNWLLGISIDGPQELHDRHRRGPRQAGGASFDKVMQGIRLLQKHGVEWNAMGVVSALTAGHALDVYHFYKDIGCQYIQFAPVVERLQHHDDGRRLASPSLPVSRCGVHPSRPQPVVAPFSVRRGDYGRFCCDIFDEWVRQDVGQVFVQLFDSTLARWAGEEPGVCTMCESCGHVSVVEANGDLYSCDHYVFPEYRLGNIRDESITSMMHSRRQVLFGRSKRDALPRQCKECRWRFACNGGCPKDRFCQTGDGEDGLSYLCGDYRQYFGHVAPYMDFMKNELDNQRPPANIMNVLRTEKHLPSHKSVESAE